MGESFPSDRGLIKSHAHFHSLAGSTLKGAVALGTFLAVALSVDGALAVADEVEDHLHLLGEAQGFDLNDFRFAVIQTLLRLDGNDEGHLETRGEFTRL